MKQVATTVPVSLALILTERLQAAPELVETDALGNRQSRYELATAGGLLVVSVPDSVADSVVDNAAAETLAIAAGRDAENTNDRTIRDRLEASLGNLEAANTNWATLTAAQKDAAARVNVRSTAGLIRLLLRRLDTAG